MIIGLAGPCDPRALARHLDGARGAIPAGELGIPLHLLADALLDQGHRVIIYTLCQGRTAPLRLTGPNLVVHQGPYRPRHRMRDWFAEERRHLEWAMRADPPDIMHVHWGYENALAATAAKVAPILVTLHDWAPVILRWQMTPYRLGRLALQAKALRGIDALAAPSPYLANLATRWLRRDCAVIPPGQPPEHFAPTPRPYPTGAPLLISANQGFGRRKNLPALLRALPAIRRVFPEARLRLLGYGHEPGGLAQAWALARNLGDGVEFIGEVPQSDVPRHFSEAHLMVHPSQEEAFGHVLIEAMGMGTPVIAAAEAQAPTWILGQGRNGVVVPCHSPGPLAEACIALLSDKARWEAVGLAGWTAARREFTVARMTEAYLALYRQILGA